jgi:dihydrolipoamide dehydrogenase
VTVLELMPQILPGWDEEVARLLERSLTRQGLRIHTAASITGAEVGEAGVTVRVTATAGGAQEIPADKLLVAVGRRPATAELRLETVGITPEARSGRIVVDSRLQAAPGVYAIGDLTPGPALAHKAEEEGVAVAEILALKAGHVRYDTIPLVVYTDPEVASVGASERQLRETGVAFRKGTFPFRANGRALAMDSTEGMVKLLADARTDQVVGAQIVGPHASELVAEVVAVMEFGGSAEDVARTVHAHPTLSEVVREAALDVDARSLHAPPRRR